jgi:glucokinase
MRTSTNRVVVGLDNGGKVNNATVLESSGRFLVDGLIESPSLVREGPDIAIEALARTFDDVLALTGTAKSAVLAVGLDTPGPASAEGVISSRGSTNFSHPAWRSFDVRRALEDRLQLPVIYNNDGNAAALYAHQMHFRSAGGEHCSIAAIVGTGLGGSVIEAGLGLGPGALPWRLWPRFRDSQATLFTDSSRPHNSLVGCR